MAKKSVTIHFAVEPKVKAALNAEARDMGLPLSFIIRKALQQYIATKEQAAA